MSALGNDIAFGSKQGALRVMRRTDLPQVLRIEQLSYAFPWSQQIFEDCLNNHYHCWVLLQSARIRAYAIWSQALGEAHLLNICVHPDQQRRGLAERILGELCHYASARGGKTLFLEVRPSNQDAIKLYQHTGFCEVGVRKNYYPASNGREDALIMAKALDTL